MKVIFSRKGVDSAAGKCASPLICERPISLPIPTKEPSSTTYGQLRPDLAALANELSGSTLTASRACHLDPDIDHGSLDHRLEGWRGALGQVSSSLSHLRNQGIGKGDLFLFWGLYRAADQTPGGWRYSGPRQHMLFGWLHVEEICDVEADRSEVLRSQPWLSDHPHLQPGWTGPNAVYVASSELELAGRKFPGSGVFRRAAPLTELGSRLPSSWSVPPWLDPTTGGVGMSYHPPHRWMGRGRLKSAARGQEFVADIAGRADAEQWLADLLSSHS